MEQKKLKSKNSSPSVFTGSRGRDPSPSVRPTALGEASLFTESHILALGKGRLPRVLSKALGKIFFIFSCNGAGGFGRQVTFFFLGAALPRVLHSGKRAFPECRSSPSARYTTALGEASLSRVQFFPECNTRGRMASLSARFLTLGEARDTRGILPLP